ncbi:MAG: hypothetical protein JWL90_93 [Chthoniobacteraceae bacterium]|nr:hypothetical protein [Chthoniobacteraceae bacterium]
MPRDIPRLHAFWFCLLLFCTGARAHDGLDLFPPISVPEAWNVLTLTGANIEKLAAGRITHEIPTQAELALQAIRFLQGNTDKLKELLAAAIHLSQADPSTLSEDAATYRTRLKEAAAGYPDAVVHAPVFSCPMCKGIRELDFKVPCFKCGMKLVARTIPATGTPGEPSVILTPALAAPLVAGQQNEITLKLTWKQNGQGVTPEELLVVHTERIHLLIIDESLGDYHHEHPKAGSVPGEYHFGFTPRRPGAYRVFADLTPSQSGAQEYPMCDLPGAVAGTKELNRLETHAATLGDQNYTLRWLTGGGAVRARQPVAALVTITDPQGKPFQRLEPVMGAYAHIVGFYEDRKTVVHIHPSDAEPKRPTDRGGPSFQFRFYAPRPGFIRLYCQVQIDGAQQFVPFGLIVAP